MQVPTTVIAQSMMKEIIGLPPLATAFLFWGVLSSSPLSISGYNTEIAKLAWLRLCAKYFVPDLSRTPLPSKDYLEPEFGVPRSYTHGDRSSNPAENLERVFVV